MTMELLAISPPGPFPEETRWIPRLLEAGLARYHLRKPAWPRQRLRAFIDRLPVTVRPRIVLHQQYPLVEPMGLGGWHLRDIPQAGRIQQRLRAAGADAGRLSRSLHRIRDLTEMLDGFAYGFLSPIFASISKIDHVPAWSEAELRQALQAHRASRGTNGARIHALGGICPESAHRCRALGFDGLVLHGALWRHANPASMLSHLQESLS
jgi:thiamine-phosphate pyrophosphorylase